MNSDEKGSQAYNSLIFERVKRDGEIVDSEGRLWTNYTDYRETWSPWKFHKKT